jgi:hypothetical protein
MKSLEMNVPRHQQDVIGDVQDVEELSKDFSLPKKRKDLPDTSAKHNWTILSVTVTDTVIS